MPAIWAAGVFLTRLWIVAGQGQVVIRCVTEMLNLWRKRAEMFLSLTREGFSFVPAAGASLQHNRLADFTSKRLPFRPLHRSFLEDGKREWKRCMAEVLCCQKKTDSFLCHCSHSMQHYIISHPFPVEGW